MGCAVQFFKIRVKHHRGRELHQEQDARSRTIMFQHRKSRDLHRKTWGGGGGGREGIRIALRRASNFYRRRCVRSWRFYIGFFPFPSLLKTFFHLANCPSLAGQSLISFSNSLRSFDIYISPIRYSCNSVDWYISWKKIRWFEMIIHFEKLFFISVKLNRLYQYYYYYYSARARRIKSCFDKKWKIK